MTCRKETRSKHIDQTGGRRIGYAKYYRARLTEEEKAAYDCLYQGLAHFESTIRMPRMERKSLQRLSAAVDYDNPELFHVDFRQMRFISTGQSSYAEPDYLYLPDAADALRTRMEAAASNILAQAEGMAEQEKELYLHDYLIHHGAYGERADRRCDAHNIRGALLDGLCVCEGFAKAFKYLCDAAHIPCIQAVGELKDAGGRHAWNIVRIGLRTYHVDVTHDLVAGQRYASRANFNLSDAEMLYDRTPEALFGLPPCPVSGAMIPLIGSKQQLTEHLRTEAGSGRLRTEVRLTRGFTMAEMERIVFEGYARCDLWARWISGIRYADGNRAVTVLWKEGDAARRAAARISRAAHRVLDHVRTLQLRAA